MAEVKSGWKSSETQVGVMGAVSALIVSGLVAYFGVTVEQATTIAAGLATAAALLWKVIEARRSIKVEASKTEATQALAATVAPPAVPPPAPADPKAWVDIPPAMLITPKPDPYGREGDLERS